MGGSETYGMLANANSAVQSTGASTTGSYTRDLMRVLATLGSLSSSQVNDPSFAPLVQDASTSLNGAISAMANDAGVMGDRQTQMTATATELASVQTALTGQLSSAQDVDMAAALSQLSSVQTQLQASYKLINQFNTMSLANYITG
jgi:flagellin-like hook-associated protein FlgL